MNSATICLISALIFVFTTPLLSSTATDAEDLVYDTDGNPLQIGVGYVISPPVWGPLGGSLKLATPVNNETCEADVIQDRFDIYHGTPFTFTPVNPDEDVIKLGFSVAIQSPTDNPCGTSTIWKVSTRDGLSGSIITTGGISNTPDSCLRIVKPPKGYFPYAYMFEYCPFMCGAGFKICRTLGIYTDDGYRHLSTGGTTGMAFPFVFIKQSEFASKIDLVSSMMSRM